ncbi:MAG: type II toxin-antitoxin system ParD family antitoxin [Flavipsychrobacter sp.]|nr:type II toxin-antitoxin system ParD family antitoxin [Flavipsychrobacter sp.]
MGRNTSVSLGPHFETFIEEKVSDGRYQNASEVIRAGLRLLEEEENRILLLRSAIEEGVKSGIASDFTPETLLDRLKAQKRSNG